MQAWSLICVGIAVGFILCLFLVVVIGDMQEPPAGYVRCKNFADCGWWFKQWKGAFDVCNHCFTETMCECGEDTSSGTSEQGLRSCEEDPEIGPDWRAS